MGLAAIKTVLTVRAFVVDSVWWFRHYAAHTPCFGCRTPVPHDPSMVIRKIPKIGDKIRAKIPDTLPHAHLYLEDVQEITNILLEATAPVVTRFREEAKVVYRAGDWEMDSIDDLRTQGGSATDFQISVGSRSLFNSVQLRRHLEPQIRLYSLGQQECWAVHAKLEAIFDHRQLTIKNAIFRGPRWNAILRLPGWMKWVAYVAILFFPTLVSRVVAHIGLLTRVLAHIGLPSRVVAHIAVVRIGPTFFVGYWIFVVLLGFIYFWPSRVSLVHSYERSSTSSAARRKAFVAIMLLATVAVAGAIRLLFGHFFK